MTTLAIPKDCWESAAGLLAGKLSEVEFCEAIGTTIERVEEDGLRLIGEACAARDADAVELGLFIGHRFGFTERHLGVLLELAEADWHQRHEDVVDGLAKLRAPSSVESLARLATARFAYLAYDEAFALGVKAIWALGKIGTGEAVARLRELQRCGNAVLEENATRQLTRIGAG